MLTLSGSEFTRDDVLFFMYYDNAGGLDKSNPSGFGE